MSTVVYFAHPIDQVPVGELSVDGGEPTPIREASRVLDVIDAALRQVDDTIVFDPARAWFVKDCGPSSVLQVANMRLIESTVDVVLVAAPAGVPTIGTWLEVEQALKYDKRVVIVTDISGSFALEYLATRADCSVVYLGNPTETTHADEVRRLINAS